MLVAARVRVALNVQHDPAGLCVAVALLVPQDGFRVRLVFGRDVRGTQRRDEETRRQSDEEYVDELAHTIGSGDDERFPPASHTGVPL